VRAGAKAAPSRGATAATTAEAPPPDEAGVQPTSGSAPAPTGPHPSRDDIVKAWGDGLLASLKGRARALYRTGRFARVEEDGVAVFAVPNDPHRKYSEECKRDVEDALERHFGVRVPIRLVVEADPSGGGDRAAPPDVVDLSELADAPAAPPARPEDRLLEAFPGAEEVER
jgi:hypothetical protein